MFVVLLSSSSFTELVPGPIKPISCDAAREGSVAVAVGVAMAVAVGTFLIKLFLHTLVTLARRAENHPYGHLNF